MEHNIQLTRISKQIINTLETLLINDNLLFDIKSMFTVLVNKVLSFLSSFISTFVCYSFFCLFFNTNSIFPCLIFQQGFMFLFLLCYEVGRRLSICCAGSPLTWHWLYLEKNSLQIQMEFTQTNNFKFKTLMLLLVLFLVIPVIIDDDEWLWRGRGNK